LAKWQWVDRLRRESSVFSLQSAVFIAIPARAGIQIFLILLILFPVSSLLDAMEKTIHIFYATFLCLPDTRLRRARLCRELAVISRSLRFAPLICQFAAHRIFWLHCPTWQKHRIPRNSNRATRIPHPVPRTSYLIPRTGAKHQITAKSAKRFTFS
jgi:hypothetical protein